MFMSCAGGAGAGRRREIGESRSSLCLRLCLCWSCSKLTRSQLDTQHEQNLRWKNEMFVQPYSALYSLYCTLIYSTRINNIDHAMSICQTRGTLSSEVGRWLSLCLNYLNNNTLINTTQHEVGFRNEIRRCTVNMDDRERDREASVSSAGQRLWRIAWLVDQH